MLVSHQKVSAQIFAFLFFMAEFTGFSAFTLVTAFLKVMEK